MRCHPDQSSLVRDLSSVRMLATPVERKIWRDSSLRFPHIKLYVREEEGEKKNKKNKKYLPFLSFFLSFSCLFFFSLSFFSQKQQRAEEEEERERRCGAYIIVYKKNKKNKRTHQKRMWYLPYSAGTIIGRYRPLHFYYKIIFS